MRKCSQMIALSLTVIFSSFPQFLRAQTPQPQSQPTSYDVRELTPPASELRGIIERYNVDRASLARSYPISSSPARESRFRNLYADLLRSLEKLDFDKLGHNDQVDYLLFKNHLDHELRQLDIQAKQLKEIEPLVPFASSITDLEEARRRMEPIDSAKAAVLLTELRKEIDEKRKALEVTLKGEPKIKKTSANRAVNFIAALKGSLKNWYTFYDGYDPLFTWWTSEPYKALDQSLTTYSSFLSEKIVGIKPAENTPRGANSGPVQTQNPRPGAPTPRAGDISDIIGDPIGREALLSELQSEMIPYTPEELIAIAEKDMAWCELEMKKASRELGYGDDWRKALEHVKNDYVKPGEQPELIRALAVEAIKFVDDHDLVTVPQLARDTWRMEMMTPERQLVSPFFLGGEVILVSYPTNGMAHEQKMMSMRGNNRDFARATVFHELIPGHHLQGFMTARYRPYRNVFSTPFWGEGWALYWEMLMWDLKFAKTPENRIGMLFWRMHRGARIIFSLSFHLEKMTPQECIDLLVQRVGHEVDNATAEVRRSLDGSYGPLYQAAYLLGGMQLYALHHELVDSGKLTNRQFHDAVLKENRIPIEMVRAILTKQKLSRDFKTNWRFAQ